MSQNRTKAIITWGVCIAIPVIAAVLLFQSQIFPKKEQSAPEALPPDVYLPPPVKDSIPLPVKRTVLPDSTKVFLSEGADIRPVRGYPRTREIRVNGDIFFDVPARTRPLILRSDLLILSVRGRSALRTIAYQGVDGEEVQVLAGEVHVKKAYASPFSEPDTLHAGENVMINKSIDLMEKEKFDPADLRRWRDSAFSKFGNEGQEK